MDDELGLDSIHNQGLLIFTHLGLELSRGPRLNRARRITACKRRESRPGSNGKRLTSDIISCPRLQLGIQVRSDWNYSN